MKISLIRHPTEDDWFRAKQCAVVTIGRKAINPPTEEWKKKLIASRHSPLRTLMFTFYLEDIPSWVSVHLCRHIHAQPYVKSQRNDRQNEYDRNEAPQDSPVNMIWEMNAEELLVIMNKRLCGKTQQLTKEIVQKMKELVEASNPEFKNYMVPMCEYHGGKCYEFESCGLNQFTTKKEEAND